MASISTDPNGNRTIQFVGSDGKRRSIRLGKVPKKLAESMKTKVEHLHATNRARLPLDPDTAAWLAGLGGDLHAKLAAVGLLASRESRTVGELCDWYLTQRRTDGHTKPATVVNLETVTKDVRSAFGESADLRDITDEQARAFHAEYRTRGLAGATMARRLTTVRSLFAAAIRKGWITANPFAAVRGQAVLPTERQHYIPVADLDRLFAVCRSEQWRLILVLSRLAGMRCPSEVLSLRWDGVDLNAGSMIVHSPKTEYIPGKGQRVMPIFPAVRTHLEAANRSGPFVVGGEWGDHYRAKSNTPKGWVNCNLRRGFERIIRRAKMTPWPRLFHNLRASCETDLVEVFPLHVVAAWLGNTPGIATKHYLQVTDVHFQKAVQFAGQSVAFRTIQGDSRQPGGGRNDLSGADVSGADSMGTGIPMGEEGLEPLAPDAGNQVVLPFARRTGAESGAVPSDPELSEITRLWPILPPEVRAGIMAMVRACGSQQRKAG